MAGGGGTEHSGGEGDGGGDGETEHTTVVLYKRRFYILAVFSLFTMEQVPQPEWLYVSYVSIT